MIRKTFLWAILGLLAVAGLASESQASLISQGHFTTAAAGGSVTVDFAVYDKAGADYGTGNATVEGVFAGGSNFLYLYQVRSDNDSISQISIQSFVAGTPPLVTLLATGPDVVDDVLMDSTGPGVSFVAGSTRSTTPSTFGANVVRGNINEVSPPSASAILGFTSAYGPVTGRLAAQTDENGENVAFLVDVPNPDSHVPPPVPEPGTLVLSAIALVGGFAMRRRMVVA